MIDEWTKVGNMNRFVPVEGSDLSTIEPVGGVFHVAGLIRSPHQLISIKWEVDNASGSTECEAWRGQHEIDCLTRAGYTVLSVELAKLRTITNTEE